MKILYVILVLSTIAVVGVALAIFWRVRRHLSQQADRPAADPPEPEQPLRDEGVSADTE